MFVHDLNQFVTVQPVEETPAVVSLGKLCKDHGYSYERVSGQEPRFTKEGKSIIRKTDNFIPLVVPRLSVNSRRSSSPATLPKESSRTEADQASRNRDASSSSSGSVSERSDEQATRRLGRKSLKIQNQSKKKKTDKKGGIQRESGEHRIACTSTQFSRIRLGTSCRSGNKIEEAQY